MMTVDNLNTLASKTPAPGLYSRFRPWKINPAMMSVKTETVVEDTKRKLEAATNAYKEKNNLK